MLVTATFRGVAREAHTQNGLLVAHELAAEVEELFGVDARVNTSDDEDTGVGARLAVVAH